MAEDIIFSTTRQWNPGDEFILRGVRNIFDAMNISYNPIIYNRNPDIRPMHQHLQLFRTSKYPEGFDENDGQAFLEANVRFGFFDNSVKPDYNGKFTRMVVFAGTPEWCNMRMSDLYSLIAKYNIPLVALGVGGGYWPWRRDYHSVIRKAKAIVVRDRKTYNEVVKSGLKAKYLPCPALLSATPDQEKRIRKVQRIGLIFQASKKDSVIWSGLSDVYYISIMKLYRRLLTEFGSRYKFEFVCHYVDEIPLLRVEFPNEDFHYSYDASDYYDIYRRFDFVIGPRVHGVGVASSIGIPGLAIVHDHRGGACEGFLAEMVQGVDEEDKIIGIVRNCIDSIREKNKRLISHKRLTLLSYIDALERATHEKTVNYEVNDLVVPTKNYSLSDIKLTGVGELTGVIERRAYLSQMPALTRRLDRDGAHAGKQSAKHCASLELSLPEEGWSEEGASATEIVDFHFIKDRRILGYIRRRFKKLLNSIRKRSRHFRINRSGY